jgi:hypothetical protein
MSFHQSASLQYQYWASANDWHPGHVILAANMDMIYSPLSQTDAVVCVDGLWGKHEWMLYLQPYHLDFPYLPWLHVASRNSPPDILTCATEKGMWQPHPNKTHAHVVHPAVLADARAKLENVKSMVAVPFHEIITLPHFASVQHPQIAYAWAFKAFDHLEREFATWRDFVEVFRNFQHCLAELFAFVDWWKDVQAGDNF